MLGFYLLFSFLSINIWSECSFRVQNLFSTLFSTYADVLIRANTTFIFHHHNSFATYFNCGRPCVLIPLFMQFLCPCFYSLFCTSRCLSYNLQRSLQYFHTFSLLTARHISCVTWKTTKRPICGLILHHNRLLIASILLIYFLHQFSTLVLPYMWLFSLPEQPITEWPIYVGVTLNTKQTNTQLQAKALYFINISFTYSLTSSMSFNIQYIVSYISYIVVVVLYVEDS